jgi:hypothetical protein
MAMPRDGLTCREVVELATDYFEAGLPAAHGERFAAHVARCRGCQTYLRQLRMTVDIVKTVAERAPVDTTALRSAFREWSASGDADVDPD